MPTRPARRPCSGSPTWNSASRFGWLAAVGWDVSWRVGLRDQAAQVDVEPAAVAQGVAKQPVVRPGQRQRLGQAGLVVLQEGGHPVQCPQRRSELSLVVADEARKLNGERLRA